MMTKNEKEKPMRNLLQETLKILEKNKKSPQDVWWVGFNSPTYAGRGYTEAAYMKWIDFEKLAKNHNYEDGYTYDELPQNLIVVGEKWWLERAYYDGCGSWVFRQYIRKPSKRIFPSSLRELCK